MGIFGKKESCPICDQPVKGMTSTRIKDKQKLCNNCSEKIKMDASMLPFQTPEDIRKHLMYREENMNLLYKFSPTKEVKCGFGCFREDSKLKKWYYTFHKIEKNPPIFDYEEIIDYQLTEDGEQIASGGLGSAVAGGVMFDGVGAIVGSNIASKRSKSVVRSMRLYISLKNQYVNQIQIEFLPMGETKKGSLVYQTHKKEANNVISFLNNMCAKAAAEKTLAANSAQPSAVSSADEILKFKNLLDSGIISQEEFDAKKKQLLGF